LTSCAVYLIISNVFSIFTRQYELRLSASDNLKENHTTVVIHVKDVNDNPPVFERPTYKTQITEEDDRSLPKSIVQVGLVDLCLLPYPEIFLIFIPHYFVLALYCRLRYRCENAVHKIFNVERFIYRSLFRIMNKCKSSL